MKKIYLSLFSATKPYLGQIGIYDINKKRWVSNPFMLTMDNDLLHDLKAWGFGECYFYLSRFKDLSDAKLDRNRDGEIKVSDRPRKLPLVEGIGLATKTYNSSRAQLANLKPSALTDENRYIRRVSIFTDSVLSQAAAFRGNGMSLSGIAARLGVNYESLRKTMRNMGR